MDVVTLACHCKRLGILIFFALLCSPVVASSYELPITREGVTTTRVAYNSWIGEYPMPVINLKANKRGYTTIPAYRSLRKLKQSVSCTIKNGLYHPWSKTPNSSVTYYTLVALATYKALKNTRLEQQPIAQGDRVARVHALGEGYCVGELSAKGNKKSIEFYCGDIDKPIFQEIYQQAHFHEQWIYLVCREGYKAFVQDQVLLRQPGVNQGQIIDYGKVGP